MTFSRFLGSLLERNSRTRSGGGNVPARSRHTRRRNSLSLERPEGMVWNLRSFEKTYSSMKLKRGTFGYSVTDGLITPTEVLAACPAARTSTEVSPGFVPETTPSLDTCATSVFITS